MTLESFQSLFDEEDEHVNYFRCRRYPPAIAFTYEIIAKGSDSNSLALSPWASMEMSDANRARHPEVGADHWCGEWKSR